MDRFNFKFTNVTEENLLKIQKSYNRLNYIFEGLEEYRKMTSIISKSVKIQLDSLVSDFERWNKDFQSNIFASIKGITNSDSFTKMNEVLSRAGSLSDLQREQLQQLSKIDFERIFSNTFINSSSFKNSINTAYKMAQEEIGETGEAVNNNTPESDFSSVEELEEAINEHINNPKGFQERFANWSKEKIVKYYIIWQIICFLWINFIQPYFQQNIGVPVTAYVVSKVKELPEKEAKVICKFKENMEAFIIENASYYYKIFFVDENGIEREGYVAKKNLKLLKEEKEVVGEERNEQE